MLGIGRRLACAIGMALLASGTAFAHPGHGRGGGDFSALHYLGEPEHLLLAVPWWCSWHCWRPCGETSRSA